jgi:type II secretory pathway component PulL
MARSTSVIGLSRAIIEGLHAGSADGAPQPARPVFAEAAAEASLAAFLSEAKWEPGTAVIVLSTEEATFRRLKFPFREPRRIRQVIRYELESELLDDVAPYAIEQEIAPSGEGGADVQAYLVKADRVQAAVAATRAAGQQPYRVTLSAHALLAAQPPAAAVTYQVYAGAEECFIALVHDGRIEAVRSVSTGLTGLVLELQRQGIASPREIRWVLQGETDSDKINRGLVRSRMLSELAVLVAELNLFLRVHDQGKPSALVFFGLFGGFLRLGAAGRIEVVEDPPKAESSPERRYLGIVEELQRNPEALRARQGLNFYAAGHGLWGQLADLRRPLIAAAVLLALVVVLGGTQYVVRTVELWRERSAVEAQIEAIIRKNVASNPPVATGLPILRERVQKARDEVKGTARFATYQYDGLAMLAELSATIGAAPGVTVESLTLGKDRLSLVGTTPSFQASEALKNRLGTLAAFKGKEPKLTHQRAGQTITFRMTID